MPARGIRSAALSVALFLGATLSVVALGGSPASAAPGCSYSITGGHLSTSQARVGDTVQASATVAPSKGGCTGTTVTISAPGILSQPASCHVPSTGITCVAQFVATESGTFHAALPNQTPVSIGTLTVVGTPTSSTKKTTAPPPTSTSPHPTTKVTTSASTSASARKKKTATPTITRSNPAIVLPDSPWETGTLSGEAPAPSDVGGSTDPGIPLSNEVTHGSGGVSPPLGLVLVSVIVIAGLLGAVVRMIIVHTRAQAGPTR